MYYVLYGTDFDAVREKTRTLLGSIEKKKPDVTTYRVTSENWTPGSLDGALYEQGLFEQKLLVTLDRLSEHAPAWDEVLQRRKEIRDSKSVFILREGHLTKDVAKKLATYAERSEMFDKKSTEPMEESFAVFSLANALARRDRKQLWILYQKTKREGIDDAAIQGILFWKVKDMMMRHDTRNYSEEELLALARDLVTLVFRARRGMIDLADGLERFTLTLRGPSGV